MRDSGQRKLTRITAHPRGAFISVGDYTPTEKDLLTTCRTPLKNCFYIQYIAMSMFYIERHIIFILWHIPSIYMKSLYTSFLLYMQAYSTSLSLVSLLFFASIPTDAPHCKPHSPDWWTAAAPPQSPTLLPDICHTAVLISLRLHKFW